MMRYYLFLCVFTVSCTTDLCKTEVVEKISSPDAQVKFIVSKRNCGATTSNAYLVHVTDNESVSNNDDPVFVADRVKDLKVFWTSNSSILIEYESARIFSYKNFWSKLLNGKYRNVSITELKN